MSNILIAGGSLGIGLEAVAFLLGSRTVSGVHLKVHCGWMLA